MNGFFEKIAEAIGGAKDLGPNIKKFTPPGSILNPISKELYFAILNRFFEFYANNYLNVHRYGSLLITEFINNKNPEFLKKIIEKEINNLPLIQDTISIISKQLSVQINFKDLRDLQGVMKEMQPEDGIALLFNMEIDYELQYEGDLKNKIDVDYQLDKLKDEFKKRYFQSDFNSYRLTREEYEKNKNKNPLDYRSRKEENLRKKEEKTSLWWRPILNDDSSDSDSESVQRTAQATSRRRAPPTPQSGIMSIDSSDEE